MNRVLIGQRILAKDKKSRPGLVGILDAEILTELTDEDVTLRLMKTAIRNRDYEGFARIDPYIKTFWDSAALVDGCLIIDDRVAIPSCLQRAFLSRLHRSKRRWLTRPSICGGREFIVILSTSAKTAENVQNLERI